MEFHYIFLACFSEFLFSIFTTFFAFLFVVCLARILIIGNKFVFNSTTLRTKRKRRSREAGVVSGGAEINVAYALQMMESWRVPECLDELIGCIAVSTCQHSGQMTATCVSVRADVVCV